jgi:serine protease AprX
MLAPTSGFAQLAVVPQPTLEPSPLSLDKLDPVLRAVVSNADAASPVIVRVAPGMTTTSIAALVQLLGGTPGRELPILNAFAAVMPNASIPLLAENPDVQRIAFDRPTFGSLDRTNATVGSSAVRAATGYDGHGIGIAVIDSGITPWHDDLGHSGTAESQRVRQFVDFVGGASTPSDDYGHGSHVAGIIVGNGFDSGGARSGIAPAAHLIALKVLDQQGRGRISDVIAALDYVAAHKDAFGIRVVNMSIGAAVHESYNSDLLTLAAKRVVDLGIVVVAAAGNAGRTADGKTVYGGIGAPGNAPWVVTVGASSHMGTLDRGDDTVARFSSRGPTVVDRLAKPDLIAPGVGIVSLSDERNWLHHSRPDARVPGTVATPQYPYLSLNGTSQAAPVVSGTVALMLHANPSLTPNAVKAILEYTSGVSTVYDTLTQGAGFLNAHGAVELATFFAGQSSAFPDATSWSRQIIWGNYRWTGEQLPPASDAWSVSVVWGDAAYGGNALISATSEMDPRNVVWGTTCGGSDCSSSTWSTSYDDDTVVWGNATDDDTVVWGNSSDDDTVVWGNSSDDDTVVWGNSCATVRCEP